MLGGISYLRPALSIPLAHHEHWDGTGYPKGMKGQRIPLQARIFSVVDHYDALSSRRPYRKAWPKRRVIAYLRENSGKVFDPEVVETFLRLHEQGAFGKDT
jgi:HD-GYP domain-containing protein (c-di-GMP phosphodiesterase class II)